MKEYLIDAATGVCAERPARFRLGLFRGVANAGALKRLITAEEKPSELDDVVLVNAEMLLHERHCLAALQRAAHHQRYNKLKTRNIGSEIIYCLSPGSSIMDAFKSFGLTDNTSSVLAIKVVTEGKSQCSSVEQTTKDLAMMLSAEAVECDLETLTVHCNIEAVVNCYKIPVDLLSNDKSGNNNLLKYIIETIALKGVL